MTQLEEMSEICNQVGARIGRAHYIRQYQDGGGELIRNDNTTCAADWATPADALPALRRLLAPTKEEALEALSGVTTEGRGEWKAGASCECPVCCKFAIVRRNLEAQED